MNIHKQDISDILSELPEIKDFNAENNFDILICSLGFEDRTYHIIEEFDIKKNLNNKDLIVITYPTNDEENRINIEKFQNKSDDWKSISFISYNNISFYNDLKTIVKSKINSSKSRIFFDISTCSSYMIYPSLKALFNLDIELTLGYTEAEFYFPTYEEWQKVEEKANLENNMFPQSYEDAKFLSKGIDDVYSSNLFSEMNPGNNPSIFIAIPNFTKNRMISIIEKDKYLNKTSDGNIIWMLGEPPAEKNKWRLDALEKIYNVQNVSNNNKKTLSTFNYKETIEKLEEIWIDYRYSFHITIGNLGSKLQHVGTFFYLLLHPDNGLLLAEPKEFVSKYYSNGFGSIYQINFGSTTKLREKLSQYLKFKLDENFPRKS
jgi:hypothetical protein